MKSTDLIQPTAIQTPIAVTGDKVIPNQTATGIDTSSIEAGFLPITSQPLESGGEAPERTDFNGMFYLATDQRVFLQNGGFITYDADVVSAIGGYPQNAVLGYLTSNGFGFVRSLIDDNAYNFVETPSYINGEYWEYTHLFNIDSDITDLANAITALRAAVVLLTGNQTVSGVKTFSSSPIVPTVASNTNNTQTASTAFVKNVLSSSGNGLATFSKGQNGYIKFANGIIMQWGRVTATNDNTTITLPTPFSSADYSVNLTPSYVGSSSSSNLRANNYKTTSFNLYAESVERRGFISWSVIGY